MRTGGCCLALALCASCESSRLPPPPPPPPPPPVVALDTQDLPPRVQLREAYSLAALDSAPTVKDIQFVWDRRQDRARATARMSQDEWLKAAPVFAAKPLRPFRLRLLAPWTGAAPALPGQSMPGDPAGTYFSSASLRGRVAVIDFWGVWCGPCTRQLPDIQRVWERYRGDPDVVILTIDYRDGPDRLRQYMDDSRFDFPVLLGGDYPERVGVIAYPTLLVLDPRGRKHVRPGRGALYDELVTLVEAARGSR